MTQWQVYSDCIVHTVTARGQAYATLSSVGFCDAIVPLSSRLHAVKHQRYVM